LDSITQAYDQLIERIARWAEAEPDLRAVAVVGSRARTANHPADEWSDLDLLMVAETPERYTGEEQWVAALGDPWLTFVEPTAVGAFWERRVLYAGGLDVDFALLPATVARRMSTLQQLPDFAIDLFRRGIRILLDRDGLLASMQTLALSQPSAKPVAPPSQHDYLEVVNDFWYHTVWVAKHLRRGELWWAKSGSDGRLKALLQRMLEWHAQAHFGPGHDTWFRGRFLEEWIDPRARQALPQVFAHYDAPDIARALFAMMDLFRWLATETGVHLGVLYPTAGDEHATALVSQILADGRMGRG
jgi:aminoglycoside 6-adenylyltransferase